MKVSVANQASPDWDAYAQSHPQASVYHQSCWIDIPAKAFGQKAFYIEARTAEGALTGILPLVRQPGIFGGCFLTSLPYFNYGGALADSDEIAQALMARAVEIGQQQNAKYIEFRDVTPRSGAWQVRTDKVSMILDLTADTQMLGKNIGAKLRSQIRRPDRDNPQVHSGGAELLPAFYDVFRKNMHNLGTPVLPLAFFKTVMQSAGEHCAIITLEKNGRAMAAALLVMNGQGMEIPWACCLEEAKPAGYNMKLYWECLAFSINKGCARFDFGRSTQDSGTYRFKAQWGAKPLQLHWHRWPCASEASSAAAPAGKGRDLLANTWRKLPLFMANYIGPAIAPRLPW
jgi:FemAB-related protein (PEP-CTERM system-associated)